MKRELFVLSFIVTVCSALVSIGSFGQAVTNTVMMVDQDGKLNVSGVASVQDVATNAVRVQIAETAAAAARNTAQSVTNALYGIVDNIMKNNVVIYRSGYTDAFEGLIIYTDDDSLQICTYRNDGISSGILTAYIEYVCTADIGTVKPIVMAHDTLTGGTENFVEVDDVNVDTPVKHNESKTVGGHEYSCYYSIYVRIPVTGTPAQYFYFIKVSGDTPGGDGATLELKNGVSGGRSGTFTWGDKMLTFKGGVLTGVEDVE